MEFVSPIMKFTLQSTRSPHQFDDSHYILIRRYASLLITRINFTRICFSSSISNYHFFFFFPGANQSNHGCVVYFKLGNFDYISELSRIQGNEIIEISTDVSIHQYYSVFSQLTTSIPECRVYVNSVSCFQPPPTHFSLKLLLLVINKYEPRCGGDYFDLESFQKPFFLFCFGSLSHLSLDKDKPLLTGLSMPSFTHFMRGQYNEYCLPTHSVDRFKCAIGHSSQF